MPVGGIAMVITSEYVSVVSTEYAEIARRPMESEQCALIVVDIQEKLLPPIFQKEQLVRNSKLLIRAAGVLKIPAIVSTQYAKGLGKTVPEVASLLPETEAIDKDRFSCFGSDVFCTLLKRLARQPQHPAIVRDGKPHLCSANGVGGAARRLSRACRFGCSKLANGMELEDRAGTNARRGRGDFVDRDDDLRTDAIVVVAGVQGDAAASEGLGRQGCPSRALPSWFFSASRFGLCRQTPISLALLGMTNVICRSLAPMTAGIRLPQAPSSLPGQR